MPEVSPLPSLPAAIWVSAALAAELQRADDQRILDLRNRRSIDSRALAA